VSLAIGMFDGVHIGHQAVLESCLQSAHAQGGVGGAMTFFPHPSRVLRPDQAVRLLQTPDLKARCLERLGLDFLIEQSFTPELASIEAAAFPRLLKRAIPALRAVYVGKNWRFGKGGTGDVEDLVELCKPLDIAVYSLPRVESNGEPISSTRIRTQLSDGMIVEANRLLGYPYFVEGEVVPGQALGRKIGFPTLNLDWAPEFCPRFGVYRVEVIETGRSHRWQGLANLGVRPTVAATADRPRLEIHLVGVAEADGEKIPGTGSHLRVSFSGFLRPERKFPSLEALQQQIRADLEAGFS